MKRLRLTLMLLAAFGLCALPARAAEFDRTCSLTGGSAQRLSVVMAACGYVGSFALKELTIANPDDAANDIYIGQAGVDSTTGYRRRPGDSKTYHSTGGTDVIQAADKYLYVATTQNVMISARAQ